MTNKEDEAEACHDPRLAAIMAVHLVSQVLDEAYVIANAARESGQPWQYVSMLKNLRSGKLSETDDEDIMSFAASKGDSDAVIENKMELVANVIATSTPQKHTGCSGELSNVKAESSLIGQGDEDLGVEQHELTNSTSTFINHLFDMSEVEKASCDDTKVTENSMEPIELLTQAMNKIMESYVNTALGMAFSQDVQATDAPVSTEKLPSGHSTYSFFADAFGICKDLAFYVQEDITTTDEKNLEASEVTAELTKQSDNNSDERTEENDVNRYENAYLTLNRDYDQCSDNDGEPVLKDSQVLPMQEVELMTASTSDDNLFSYPEANQKIKELTATSAVSASASGSRRGTLGRRCRTQGARLLACIRGWWRRETPGKRKESRIGGGARALSPLSPNARRRASSLLDQRLLRSPSPSRPPVWKFNTVNETLVHSSRYKDYTFDIKPEECSEF